MSDTGKEGVIPAADLERAHRALGRQVAAALVATMGVTDTSAAEIDQRLEWPPGETRRILDKLIHEVDTQVVELEAISDIAFAMGAEPRISLRYREPPNTGTEIP